MKTTEEKIKETLRKLYKLTKEWYQENGITTKGEGISEYGSATVGNMDGRKVCRLTVQTGLDEGEYRYKDIQGFAK